MNTCECGCGAPTNARFVKGHNRRRASWTAEERERHEAAMTPALRSQIAEKKRGMRQSVDTIAKRAASLKGHAVSASTRQKISDSHKAAGVKPSREAWEKSMANRGAREQQPAWKGGVTIYPNGYRCVYQPDHPRAHPNGYVYEHVLQAERKLGRPLMPGEVVHHLDQDKLNNAESNLLVFSSQAEHIRHHHHLS